MKKGKFLLVVGFFTLSAFAQDNSEGNDWDNPSIFQITREPARATFLSY